jgi:hypothetical protein
LGPATYTRRGVIAPSPSRLRGRAG